MHPDCRCYIKAELGPEKLGYFLSEMKLCRSTTTSKAVDTAEKSESRQETRQRLH